MTSAKAVEAPGTVLVYSHSWVPLQVDGVAVRMMAHIRELVDRGVKVTVVTPDFVVPGHSSAEKKQADRIDGVEHITLQTQLTPVYKKNMCMQISFRNLFTLVSVIRRVRPDIVHGTQEASMQVLATACLLCDVPLVVSVHTDVTQIANRDKAFSSMGGLLGSLQKFLAVSMTNWGYRNWALAGATYFCVSEQAKTILRNAAVREKRVAPELWGPMVDKSIFRIDLPEAVVREKRETLTFGIKDAFLMVYVGRVTAEKDVQFLVDALERAPSNVVLGLIGAGSLCEELSKLHGKEHRIHCTGEMVSREQVALSIRAADCCVSASTMETVGFTAMEALSCGTPMLAANAQGFALHLSHGVNARLWTPLDTGSFDAELATLMSTKREGNWSKEALRASIQPWSLEACTNRALRTYQLAFKPNYWSFRMALTVFFFYLNWFFSLVFGFLM
mmetsp:Transcript_32706/g.60065  ORF Transcript_32706/g.60065 Transcript_32706/m.60065 type:complete len:447 (+) Transcript_32706:103-1443(+)